MGSGLMALVGLYNSTDPDMYPKQGPCNQALVTLESTPHPRRTFESRGYVALCRVCSRNRRDKVFSHSQLLEERSTLDSLRGCLICTNKVKHRFVDDLVLDFIVIVVKMSPLYQVNRIVRYYFCLLLFE